LLKFQFINHSDCKGIGHYKGDGPSDTQEQHPLGLGIAQTGPVLPAGLNHTRLAGKNFTTIGLTIGKVTFTHH